MNNKSHPNRLHVAMMKKDLPLISDALSAGEDVDALDREKRTILFYAVVDNELDVVSLLIESGANINWQDINLETPLHFAAREYRIEAAKLLIGAGAIVDAQDKFGNSALFRAVFDSRGRSEMIKLLLSSGADKGLMNQYGVSPESLARTIANYDLSGTGIF